MSYSIEKDYIDETLFRFLKSIYTFQTVEQDVFGIGWQEIYLLQMIIRKPKMRVTELSEELRIEKFATSRLVTKLNKAGLVEKIVGEKDKRVVMVEITAKGKKVIENIEDYHYKIIAKQFSQFEEKDLRVILDSISNLDKVFKA